MKREEAIAELAVHLEHWEHLKEQMLLPCKECENTIKALDLAISALSAESDTLTHEEAWEQIDSDLISRADAVEAVMNTEPVVFDSQSLEPHQKTKDVIDALSALPSAEAVQGWIPCSERLPKPWESVMTTIRWVGDEYEDDYDIAVGFKKISGGWDLTLADGTGVLKGFLVQAWMPLPTPYKGGEDE